MNNGWTCGQYSLFRFLLGSYLFIHFYQLIPWGTELFSSAGVIVDAEFSPLIYAFPNPLAWFDDAWFITLLLVLACGASILFIMGYADRIAALFMWLCLAWLLGRNPLISNPSAPYVGWLLLAHVFIAKQPYGLFSVSFELKPANQWQLSKYIFLAAWVLLAVSYTYSGYTKLLSPSWISGDAIALVLDNPLARDYWLRDWLLTFPDWFFKGLTWAVLYIELLFLPLVLMPKFRLLMWALMLVVQVGFLLLLNFADLTMGMLLFHMFTFDPKWLRPKPLDDQAVLYFDGTCGLCHNMVKLMLVEGKTSQLRFSALQGSHFSQSQIDLSHLKHPDTIALVSENQPIKTHSTAVIRLLKSLGGYWIIVAALLWVIPKSIRDWGYVAIGKIRHRLFQKPSQLCPLVDAELSSRFI